MKVYIVGGAVRDALLGLPVQDRDHVVVGASPDEMVAGGFTPVGKDFPVFLHPKTHEEYALARTERKTAPGYKGFVFHADSGVTLEQDLARRDLTINAMAQAEDGTLIDPFNGRKDLQARVFRHVSDAFVEDPVRILRVARFAARFTDFSVAPETNELMRRMVTCGEVDALVPERVWQEVARGLMEAKPSRMFAVLRDCGALARILPELDAVWDTPCAAQDMPGMEIGDYVMKTLDIAAQKNRSLPIRFAALMHKLESGEGWAEAAQYQSQERSEVTKVESASQRLRVPNDCRDLAVMTVRERDTVRRALDLDADAIVDLLQRCDAFRKPQRFDDMLCALECAQLAGGYAQTAQSDFPQAAYLQVKLAAASSINAGGIAADTARRHPGEPHRIPQAIRRARIEAVAAGSTSS